MFEYKDDFVMSPVKGNYGGEGDRLACFAQNAAEDQLADLQRLSQALDAGDTRDLVDPVVAELELPEWTNATDATAPTLQFDLEQELSRALGNAPSTPPAEAATAAPEQEFADPAWMDAISQPPQPAPEPKLEPVSAPDLSALAMPSTPEAPSAPADENLLDLAALHEALAQSDVEAQREAFVDPAMQFSGQAGTDDMNRLFETLDATAVQGAEPTPQPAPVSAPKSVFEPTPAPVMEQPVAPPAASPISAGADNDIVDELARLMGNELQPAPPVAPAMPTAAPAVPPQPPAPSEMIAPWTEPTVVESPHVPEIDLAMPHVEPVSDWQPPQTTDFSDPAAEFQPYFEDSQSQPVPPLEPAPGPMETIKSSTASLGAFAAGAAAATAAAIPGMRAQPTEPSIEIDPLEDAAFENAFEADLAAALGEDDLIGQQPAQAPQVDMRSGDFDAAPGFDPMTSPAFNDTSLEIPDAAFIDRPRKGAAGKRVALAVLGVALLGGVAVMGMSFFGGDSGPAPTILASEEPVKVKPAESGGETVPNQDQAVYNTVDGKTEDVAGQERLADNSEQPIRVAARQSEDTKVQERIDGSQNNGVTVLKPRRVRTVVVRPDGTIVSGGVAGQAQPAAAQGTAPEIAEPKLALKADPIETGASTPVQTTGTNTGSGGLYTPPTADQPAATPVKTARIEPKPVKVEPVKVKAAEPKPVAAQPAPKPEAPIAAASSAPFAVQIASQRSQAAAQQSYANLSKRYNSILGGKGVDIQTFKAAGKGTFYRVRIPAQTRGEANTMCSALKKRGGDCFVTR